MEWTEAQALVDGARLAMEVRITPIWVNVDSKIVWNLLRGQDQHFNDQIAPLIDYFKQLVQIHHIRVFFYLLLEMRIRLFIC